MKSILYISVTLFIGLCKLAAKLRLIVPLLYALVAGTVFYEWSEANQVLAVGILIGLVVLSLGSWVVTMVQKVKRSY